ncbi:MAG: hypothetical protein R6V05_07720 [Candidatus Brocadiia bacterium]
MRKRTVGLMAAVVLIISAATVSAQTQTGLDAALPADRAVLFGRLNLGRVLDQAATGLQLVDEEAGGKIIYNVNRLHELTKELAANYGFEPMLLDRLPECEVYLAVLSLDEPIVRTRTMRHQKFDPETGEYIPGEFEEVEYTEESNYLTSLVVGTPGEDVARNFVEECRELFDFLKESQPEADLGERREIEVEQGALIGSTEHAETVGWIKNYVVISEGEPTDLWAAVMAPASEPVAQTAAFRRIGEMQLPRQAYLLVNLGALVRRTEEGMAEALAQAEEELSGQSGAAWQLQMMRQSYEAFLKTKEILSLDQIRHAAAAMTAEVTSDGSHSIGLGLLSHAEPIGPVLTELLEGSGSFQPPPGVAEDRAAIMARVDLKKIYDEVAQVLRPESAPQGPNMFDMMMQQMRMQLGTDLGGILGLLASDMYAFIGVSREQIEVPVDFDEETGEVTTEQREVLLPKVNMVWGVRDHSEASEALGDIFSRLSENPQLSGVVKKRTYMGNDVYCVGMGVADEETYPDGRTSFALVVVGRYLTMGGWDYVTGVVRRAQDTAGGDSELLAVVEQHPEANLLAVVPRSLQEKVRDLTQNMAEQQDPWEMIIEQLRAADLELEDPELEREIKQALEEIILAGQVINEKQAEIMPRQTVMTGQHSGQFYELRTEATVGR